MISDVPIKVFFNSLTPFNVNEFPRKSTLSLLAINGQALHMIKKSGVARRYRYPTTAIAAHIAIREKNPSIAHFNRNILFLLPRRLIIPFRDIPSFHLSSICQAGGSKWLPIEDGNIRFQLQPSLGETGFTRKFTIPFLIWGK